MKRLMLLIAIVIDCTFLTAQRFCYTGGDYQNQIPGGTINVEEYRVRVFFHVIKDGNGLGYGYFPTEDINLCMNRLNSDYNPLRIFFDYAGVDYIHNTDFFNIDTITSPYVHFLLNTNSHSNAIDIYLLPTETSVGGKTNGIPGTALVLGGKLDNVVLATSRVLSHEMGHCLGLFHTYHGSPSERGYSCKEYVSGNNALTCGDYILDTPADPFPLYNYINVGYCGWNNWDYYDDFGMYYAPDTRQIMADIPPNCMQILTPEQGHRMRAYLGTIQSLFPLQISSVAYVQNQQFAMNGDEIVRAMDSVVAGHHVTTGTYGDVVVRSGGDVTFEASERIILKSGFRVNQGAKFKANVQPIPRPNTLSTAKYNNSNGNYIPFLENTSWTTISSYSGGHSLAYVYKNMGDTLILGKTHKIIKCYTVNVSYPMVYPVENIFYYHEDIANRRVYQYSEQNERDVLMYDFSVQVGEKMPCDMSIASYYSNCVCTDISDIENLGITRKRYTFVHEHEQIHETDTIVWIEGVGNYTNFELPHMKKMDESRILCIKKEDITVYDTSTSEEENCDYVNQIFADNIHESIINSQTYSIPSATKILRDGQMYIVREDKTYTIQGQKIE